MKKKEGRQEWRDKGEKKKILPGSRDFLILIDVCNLHFLVAMAKMKNTSTYLADPEHKLITLFWEIVSTPKQNL